MGGGGRGEWEVGGGRSTVQLPPGGRVPSTAVTEAPWVSLRVCRERGRFGLRVRVLRGLIIKFAYLYTHVLYVCPLYLILPYDYKVLSGISGN